MRVSAETKLATRANILAAARRLFYELGFDATTTRGIAKAAGTASGTVFNYFPTKEAILAALAAEAAADALAASDAGAREADTLEEALFALVAAGLRKLRTLRKFLPVLLETTLSPLALAAPEDAASLRTAHLEAVVSLASRHGHDALSPTALQLYWTLYTGVLVFWANDESPKQEDTLALIDDSLSMFTAWLRQQPRTTNTTTTQPGAGHADRRATDESAA